MKKLKIPPQQIPQTKHVSPEHEHLDTAEISQCRDTSQEPTSRIVEKSLSHSAISRYEMAPQLFTKSVERHAIPTN